MERMSDEQIRRVQELTQKRWNAVIERQERQHRQTENDAQQQRAQIHAVEDN